MRTLLLLALVIISAELHASVTECEIADFEVAQASYVSQLYNKSDVVIELGNKIEVLDDLSKYEVLGVWKGEVGEHIYLKFSYELNAVFFGKRIEPNSPNILEDAAYPLSRCIYIKDILTSEYGKPHMPSSTFFNRNHASTLLIWSALFSLLALCGINIYLYKWINA